MRWLPRRWRRWVLIAALLLLAAVPGGLLLWESVFRERPGDIEGTVILDGKPLTSGYVVVWPSRKIRWKDVSRRPNPKDIRELASTVIEALRPSRDYQPEEDVAALSATIQPDGSFLLPGIPPGPARLCVQQKYVFRFPNLPPGARWIPVRYADPEKSGFRIDVKSGSQKFDLALRSPDWVTSD